MPTAAATPARAPTRSSAPPDSADAQAGLRSVSIAVSALDCFAAERMPVRDLARPVLMDLQEQVRETVQLGVPVPGHVVDIDRYGNSTRLGHQLSGEVLRRVPGYSSSSGRVLAAFDERIIRDTLAVPRRKLTLVGPTNQILGLRKDFIVASVCRAARRVSSLLAQASED